MPSGMVSSVLFGGSGHASSTFQFMTSAYPSGLMTLRNSRAAVCRSLGTSRTNTQASVSSSQAVRSLSPLSLPQRVRRHRSSRSRREDAPGRRPSRICPSLRLRLPGCAPCSKYLRLWSWRHSALYFLSSVKPLGDLVQELRPGGGCAPASDPRAGSPRSLRPYRPASSGTRGHRSSPFPPGPSSAPQSQRHVFPNRAVSPHPRLRRGAPSLDPELAVSPCVPCVRQV